MKRFFGLILGTPIQGFISTPIALAVFALYALMFHVGYIELAQPIANLYGLNLPEVPYWQWIAFCTIVSIFICAFRGFRAASDDETKLWRLFLSRIGSIIGLIFLSLLINWIWL